MENNDIAKHFTDCIFLFCVSAPANVENVKVIGQNETSVTLQWRTGTKYTYELKFQNGTSLINTTAKTDVLETQTVSSLTAGTEYNFTLFTVEGDYRSSGYNFTADTGRWTSDTF